MAVSIFSFLSSKTGKSPDICLRACFPSGRSPPSTSRCAWPCGPCGCTRRYRKRQRKQAPETQKKRTTNPIIIISPKMMDDTLSMRPADLDDINTIGFLAQQIWPDTYGNIVSQQQLQYMLNLIYSPTSLRRQMLDDKHQFMIVEQGEEP